MKIFKRVILVFLCFVFTHKKNNQLLYASNSLPPFTNVKEKNDDQINNEKNEESNPEDNQSDNLQIFSATTDLSVDTTTSYLQDILSPVDPVIERLNEYQKGSWHQHIFYKEDGINYTIYDFLTGNENKPTNWRVIVDYYKNQSVAKNNLQFYQFRITDSIIVWTEKINIRELYRFSTFLTQNHDIIHINTFENNDIGRAMILSGVIWAVPTSSYWIPSFIRGFFMDPQPLFSGILKPGQYFKSECFEIYTCLHGFKLGNKSDGVAYYFVPFGQMISTASDDSNYVSKIGYKITFVGRFDKVSKTRMKININNNVFRKSEFELNENSLNGENDFAIAYIEPKNNIHGSLKEHMISLHPRLFDTQDTHLPNINNNNVNLDRKGFLSKKERLFLIGYTEDRRVSVPFDKSKQITISTNLTEYEPKLLNQRYNTTLPNMPGMSGGGVIRCQISSMENVCAIIGTLFGIHYLPGTESQIGTINTQINPIDKP
jgi:hypothetical protein